MLEKYEEALQCYRRALEIDPTNVYAKDLYNKTNSIVDEIRRRQEILMGRGLITNYYEKSHAIIIGISKYKEEDQLPNAYNDAVAIKNILEKKYDFDEGNIYCLFNEDATKANLEWIFVDKLKDDSKIGPKDRVLVYYAGHGKLRIRVGRQGQEIKYGFIIPYDAQKSKYSSYLGMETVVDGCRDCPAKHTLLILDCCYSGYAAMRGAEITKPEKATDPYLARITAQTAIQVLAAGEENQPVNDSGTRRGNSAFTGALLDILEFERDVDNDGILTASEIGAKLAGEVARHTTGAPQRPVFNNLSGSELGDFVFKILKF